MREFLKGEGQMVNVIVVVIAAIVLLFMWLYPDFATGKIAFEPSIAAYYATLQCTEVLRNIDINRFKNHSLGMRPPCG